MFTKQKIDKKTSFSLTHEWVLLIVLVALVVFLSIATDGRFIQSSNLLHIVVSSAFIGIMSMGFLVVLISGGIDISFMALATVSQYIMVYVAINFGGNLISTFLLGMAVGGTLGLFNALLIYYLKAPSIIVTIATMNVFFGLLMWISRGTWLHSFPTWFGGQTPFAILALPVGVLLFTLLTTWLILRYTHMGRRIFAVGCNIEAARRMGVNVLATLIFVYVYMGIMAALSSGVQAYLVQNVAPNAIIGREMEVIAVVVLGGASLRGGRGSVSGTLFGLLLLTVIGNGMVLLGISSFYYDMFIGAVILISFCLTGIRSLRKRAARKKATI